MRRKIPGQSLQPGTTSTPQPAYRVGLRQSVNRLPYPLPNVTRSATVYASGGEILRHHTTRHDRRPLPGSPQDRPLLCYLRWQVSLSPLPL